MKKILFLFFTVSVFFSCSANQVVENEINEPIENTTEPTNPFFTYNFGEGLANLSAKEQVEELSKYGFTGMTFQIDNDDQIEFMKEVITEAAKVENFDLTSVFFRYNFELGDFLDKYEEVIDIIAEKSPQTNFWLIFGRTNRSGFDYSFVDDAYVEGKLLTITEYAKSKNVGMTLYPHFNTFYEDAEQIIPVVNRVNASIGEPYLKISIHLCHELRAGNGERMDEVVENVGDLLAYVSISGADAVPNTSNNREFTASTLRLLYWGDESIDPNQAGNDAYDITKFIKALKDNSYKGPVAMINFKLDNALDDYLPKSIVKWNQLKNEYLNY
ncbi:MAG: hypothetical protein ABF263_09370 [Polaribacter sp.]